MKMNDAISAYVKLRDAKEALAKKHKDEMSGYNEKLAVIERWVQRELDRQGMDKAGNKSVGTAFIQKVDSCTVADKEAFMKFVKDEDHFELLDIRASKTVVRDFMENTGEIPPGVKFDSARVVRIRRP